jgi:hypothetical protein
MKKITLITAICALCIVAKAQNFDTTGIGNWPRLYNSYNTWLQGAFEANRDFNDPYDFGWGSYDVTTHIISGDSIYIIKTMDGDYKAISIDQYTSNVYNVTYSNLDKSNKVTKALDRTNYDAKNFFYYSIDNDIVKDLESDTDDWDIVFSKYLILFPGIGSYGVSGALTNDGVEVSEVHFAVGGSYSVSDTTTFPMDADISTIGYDWKDAFAGIVHDTIVYYVKDQFDNVNELKFYKYGGSGTGEFGFTVNGVKDSILLGAGNVDQVYYSLQNGTEISTNQDNDWDIALYAQRSFSNLPVRINDVNGVELYVYPNSDISYWNVVSLEERTLNVMSVYPNPAKDVLNIAMQADLPQNMQVTILDQGGRVVKTEAVHALNGVSEVRIDIADLNAGLYMVQLSGDNFNATTKILVQP